MFSPTTGSFSFALDALPRDVLALLARLLTGYELLHVSHVNRRFFQELLGSNAVEWAERLSHNEGDPLLSAKLRYFTSRSLLFPGREAGPSNERERGAVCDVPIQLTSQWITESFSLDLWFALLPGGTSPRTMVGGVMIGAQSVHWSSVWWASLHQPFVHVNELRELCCSVQHRKPVVKKDLQLHRWYHVALAFEHVPSKGAAHGIQRVYVDGKLVDTSEGLLVPTRQGQRHPEWRNLKFMHIGSACITGGEPGGPDSDFCGWYGFNGLIDDCGIWTGAFSSEQVQRLARGENTTQPRGDATLAWSIKTSKKPWLFGPVQSVRCTRPNERVCAVQQGN